MTSHVLADCTAICALCSWLVLSPTLLVLGGSSFVSLTPDVAGPGVGFV